MYPILLWSFSELSHQPKVGLFMHVATLYSTLENYRLNSTDILEQ